MKKTLYYLLSCTWGILMTLCGAIAAAALSVMGYRPQKYGPCWVFVVGNGWGGVSLGPVMIMSEANAKGTRTRPHEFGHSLQNCLWGPLFPFVIAIPSATRYWYRDISAKKGNKPTTDYDAVWFEGQATEWGNKYISHFE